MYGAWDKFIDGLHLYIDNAARQGMKQKWLNIPTIDYEVKNIELLFKKHWQYALLESNKINDLFPELKDVAIQYLPRFLEEYPQYKDEKCFNVK